METSKQKLLRDYNVQTTAALKGSLTIQELQDKIKALEAKNEMLTKHCGNLLDSWEAEYNQHGTYSYEYLDEYRDAAECMQKHFGRDNNLLGLVENKINEMCTENQRSNNLFDNFRNLKF